MRRLDLHPTPRTAADAGIVKRARRFDDDAFHAEVVRGREECSWVVVGADSYDGVGRADDLLEECPALLDGPVRKRPAVECEDVERDEGDGNGRPSAAGAAD